MLRRDARRRSVADENARTEAANRRSSRVAHFRDTVQSAAEWAETTDHLGPGVFEVANAGRTTQAVDAFLDAHLSNVAYEVQSYSLGEDDRHPSWVRIALREPCDPSRLPEDATVRRLADQA